MMMNEREQEYVKFLIKEKEDIHYDLNTEMKKLKDRMDKNLNELKLLKAQMEGSIYDNYYDSIKRDD